MLYPVVVYRPLVCYRACPLSSSCRRGFLYCTLLSSIVLLAVLVPVHCRLGSDRVFGLEPAAMKPSSHEEKASSHEEKASSHERPTAVKERPAAISREQTSEEKANSREERVYVRDQTSGAIILELATKGAMIVDHIAFRNQEWTKLQSRSTFEACGGAPCLGWSLAMGSSIENI